MDNTRSYFRALRGFGWPRASKAFTLLELLMVVIIIAILAAIAVPQYLKTREKARMAEAISTLGQVRGSQARFFVENQTYAADIRRLDFDPSAAGSFLGVSLFEYACVGDAATFDCTATRRGAGGGVPDLVGTGCVDGYALHVGPAGTMTGTDCRS